MKNRALLCGITLCGLLSAMEKNAVQKSYCITVYSADNQRALVPLELMRESNVLYEQYCKKVKDKNEQLCVHAPIDTKDVQLFVHALGHKKQVNFKEYYDSLDKHAQKNLIHVGLALKSPKLNVQIMDCYEIPQDVRNDIIAMAMPMQVASESIRYGKIRAHIESQKIFTYLIPYLKSEQQKITEDQWTFVYKGNGTFYKAPLCVMHNDTAMWGGKERYWSIKRGQDIYHLEDVWLEGKYVLTLGTNNENSTTRYEIQNPGKVTFSSDGQWLVTGSLSKPYCTKFYPLDTQKQEVVTHPWDNQVNELCFNHQLTLLAIAFSNNGDNEIILQRMPQEKETLSAIPIYKSLKGHTKGVWNIQFSGDDQRLLSCSQGMFILWDIADYENIRKIKEMVFNEDRINVFFSKFGNTIVVMTPYKYVLFDGYTGECVNDVYRGREETAAGLYDVVFSNDGKFFLTIACNEDQKKGFFKLWDAQTGKEIAQLHKEYQNSNALGFTPDMRYIVDANVSLKGRSYINCTQLYNDHDAQEIKQIAQYKPLNLCDAYAVWRACKAAEDGNEYDGEFASDEIKKIITASVVKEKK